MNVFSKAGLLWSGFLVSGIAVVGSILSSCQTADPPTFAPTPVKRVTRLTNGPTRSYLGLTSEKAQAKAKQMGLRSRIVREDGKQFIITKDLRQDRINFEVDKGRVTLAKIF